MTDVDKIQQLHILELEAWEKYEVTREMTYIQQIMKCNTERLRILTKIKPKKDENNDTR